MSSPTSPQSTSTVSLPALALIVLVPHALLAKYYFNLSLIAVPEPLLSLLVLVSISLAIFLIARPILLDLLVNLPKSVNVTT